MADLDPNTWYQITEYRINLTSSLQSGGYLILADLPRGQQLLPSAQPVRRPDKPTSRVLLRRRNGREQDAPVHAAGRWRRQPEMGHRALGQRELHVRRRQERLWLPYGLPPGQPALHEFRDHGDAQARAALAVFEPGCY